MSNIRTVSYRSSAVSSSASISRAIRDERYEDLPELVSEALLSHQKQQLQQQQQHQQQKQHQQPTHPQHPTNPLWETNSRGWTPMHVAAVGCAQMSLKWWNWILRIQGLDARIGAVDASSLGNQSEGFLGPNADADADAPGFGHRHHDQKQQQQQQQQQEQQQQQQHRHRHRCCHQPPPLLWTLPTDRGQTVAELFFRASLHPMPWCKNSVRERAGTLTRAMERLLANHCDGEGGSSDETKEGRERGKGKVEHEDEDGLEALRKLVVGGEGTHRHGDDDDDNDNDRTEEVDNDGNGDRHQNHGHEEDRHDESSIHRRSVESSTAESESISNSILEGEERATATATSTHSEDVEVVFRFWTKLEALLFASTTAGSTRGARVRPPGRQRQTQTQARTRPPVVPLLATLPCCPELVARLAVALFPWEVTGARARGRPEPPLRLRRERNGNGNGNGNGCCEESTATTTNDDDDDDEDGDEDIDGDVPLPLHLCLLSPTTGSYPYSYYPDEPPELFGLSSRPHQRSGMLPVLCRAYPEAAGLPIRVGSVSSRFGSRSATTTATTTTTNEHERRHRLPLHASLARGDDWDSTARHLFAACPSAAAAPDPSTGLPCFALAVVNAGKRGDSDKPNRKGARDRDRDRDQRHRIRNESKTKSSGSDEDRDGDSRCPATGAGVAFGRSRQRSCWNYLRQKDKDAAIERARAESDRRRLTTAYEVLRRNPSVLEGLR